jgi:hypothetical protein
MAIELLEKALDPSRSIAMAIHRRFWRTSVYAIDRWF